MLYDPEAEPLFLPQFWALLLYRELLNTASRCRPSRSTELSRAASGLVKVLCKPGDRVSPHQAGSTGGRGGRGNKKQQQGKFLASFREWFGSVSWINTLYIWFPASWAPSVVEAIIKRNEKWMAQTPFQRDSSVFTAAELADQHASREMAYKIQKWNVQSAGTFPILLANTRVDWLGIDDKEITQHFPILREGILRDVFSQRASAAWQGAPPQKVTVSILLPGQCPPDSWLDYLQSQRHFWPSMTTHFASLIGPPQRDCSPERAPAAQIQTPMGYNSS